MKPLRTVFFRIAAAFALALVLSGAALAADPPGRIGRLSLISGTVETWSPGDKAWAAASLNNPITSGWAVWADRDGRAEVRVGSVAVHVAADSQVDFAKIEDDQTVVETARGASHVKLRSLAERERFLLAADGLQFELRQPGDFRLDFDPVRHRATIRVFSGLARVLDFGEQMDLTGGQQAEIDTVSRRFVSLGQLSRDGFDSWTESRNREQDRQQATRYVSPEMTGIEALDDHGRWESDASYGSIWYPRVAVGWAPYRFGHWAWIGPWGWTWIDDAPWGFAPFHYGRWVDIGGRWGWVPGRYVPRPVYAPALVGFYGGGPRFGVNVSIGIGNVGWFPLGPAEVYRPVYGASINYVRQVNVTHVTNVTQITNIYNAPRAMDHYRYAHRPDAATFVPGRVFSGARPVAPALQPVDPGRFGRLPVAPRPVLPGRPEQPSPSPAQPPRPNSPFPVQPPRQTAPSPAQPGDPRGGVRAPDKAIPERPVNRPWNDVRREDAIPNRHGDASPRNDTRGSDKAIPERAAPRQWEDARQAAPHSDERRPVEDPRGAARTPERGYPASPAQPGTPSREVRIRESSPPSAPRTQEAPRSQEAPRATPPRPAQAVETPRGLEHGQAPREVRTPNEGRQVRQIERENQRIEREERRDQRIERDSRGNNRMMQ